MTEDEAATAQGAERVAQRMEQAMDRYASACAVRSASDAWTFGVMGALAEKIRRALEQSHCLRGDIVAILSGRSKETIAAMIAVLRAKAVFFVIDTDLSSSAVQELIQQAGARFVIGGTPGKPDSVGFRQRRSGVCCYAPRTTLNLGEAAYIVATSGTTGTPKLVLNTQRGLVNLIDGYGAVLRPGPTDVRYQAASCGSDTFVLEVFLYLSHGATLYLDTTALNGGIAGFNQRLIAANVSVLGLPSSTWRQWAVASKWREMPALRAVICSMERTDPAALHTWRERGGHSLVWMNAYGPSEAACVASLYILRPGDAPPEGEIPIGKPIPNVDMKIVNADRVLLADEQIGEIAIGGAGVALGYLNDPDLTAQRFVTLADGGRYYLTGDLGYRQADGNFVFLGRRDNQVKISGYRVELEALDLALLRHVQIRDAAAIAVPHANQSHLVCFYVADRAIEPETVRNLLSPALPPGVATRLIVRRQSIPRNASGKVCRGLLASEAAELLVNPEMQVASSSQEPRSEGEKKLSAIWCELLDLPEVDMNTSFFEMGGSSLQVIRMLARVQDEFGTSLTIPSFLTSSTVASMAAKLDLA